MRMKRIVIEADFLDFNTLGNMLTDILKLAKQGNQYDLGIPYKNHVHQRFEFHMKYVETQITSERQIGDKLHLVVKSKL